MNREKLLLILKITGITVRKAGLAQRAVSKDTGFNIGHIEAGKKNINIRGQRVTPDRDFAALYQVTTSAMNQAVKRNNGRFPGDFMFWRTIQKLANLKSQIVTSSWGGVRKEMANFDLALAALSVEIPEACKPVCPSGFKKTEKK